MREGKGKRDEMRREEVGGQGAVYHTQVTMLGVNHRSIACLACMSIEGEL